MNNFILQNNDDSPLDLYQYQGDKNLLLIFFRGAWCNVCKKQLIDVSRIMEELAAQRIKVLAISSDTKLKSSLLRTFLRLNFPVLSDADLAVIRAFGLETEDNGQSISKPAIFLVAPNHEIVYSYIGERHDDRLSAEEILNNVKISLNQKL